MRDRRVLLGIPSALFMALIVVIFLPCEGEAGKVEELTAKLESPASQQPSAMDAVRKHADDDTVSALMTIVEGRRDDWKLQIAAIRLLGEIANPLATELLIKVVTDHFFTNECPALKWNGIVALGNFRNDPRVVDALLYRLDEDTLYLREAVIQSLGKIGNRDAFPYLVSALDDRHFAVRMSAVRALGGMGSTAAIARLEEVVARDAEPLIREEALRALKLLKRSPG